MKKVPRFPAWITHGGLAWRKLPGLVALVMLANLALGLPGRAGAATSPVAGGPYGKLVIRGVTVIDGTGAPPIGPVDIVIERNVIQRIVRLDPLSMGKPEYEKRRPHGDRDIEAQGMYVVPGFINMHSHMFSWVPAQYIWDLWLAHGITSVRLFTSPRSLEIKKKAAANEIRSPRIFVYAFWPANNSRAWNAAGAREIVREWKKMGVDGIKMTSRPGLYPDVFRALCDEARKQGMGVAVHIGQDGVYPMNALQVARAGATTIEHHYGYAEAAFSRTTIQDLPPSYNYADEPQRFRYTAKVWLETDVNRLFGPVMDELLDISRRRVFAMDPTFRPYSMNRDVTRAMNLPYLEPFALPKLIESWRPNPRRHATFHYAWTSADEAMWAQMFRRWMEFVNTFKNRGGHVVAGSDPGYQYGLYGFDYIRELELLQEAGFHPLEVIRSATWEGARALFADHQIGVIRPGYRADLVVVAGNPLEDLKYLYGTGVTRYNRDGTPRQEPGILYTIRDGVVFDAQALLRGIQEQVRAARSAGTSP